MELNENMLQQISGGANGQSFEEQSAQIRDIIFGVINSGDAASAQAMYLNFKSCLTANDAGLVANAFYAMFKVKIQ